MSNNRDNAERRTSVQMPSGLRASRRLAQAAVALVQQFGAEIDFRADELCIDAKSTVMACAFLEALRGRSIDLIVRGDDSEAALRSLASLFQTGLSVRRIS